MNNLKPRFQNTHKNIIYSQEFLFEKLVTFLKSIFN